MKFTVACNWDPRLVDLIDYPEVAAVFAGLPNTKIASGRSSLLIKNMDEQGVKDYIRRVHAKGWSFDYNVNSTCLANSELRADGRREIVEYLQWVSDLGVDSLTISMPLMIEIVKKHFPHLKVKVSTYQKIHSVSMVQRFEDLGADMIVLSEFVNRDFKLLKAIRQAVKCQLVLIANVGCIYDCPNAFAHANSIAHSGAKGAQATILTEAYQTYCTMKRVESRAELIKMRWIRPEDVACYEDVGIDLLKIIDRHSSTEALAERVKAYHERRFEGNLLDLIGQMANQKKSDLINLRQVLDDGGRQEADKLIDFLAALSTPVRDLFFLDNQRFPADFLDGFEKRDCSVLSCDRCGYCERVADATVTTTDKVAGDAALQKLHDVRSRIVDGSILY
jgi:collagenase-like PrtC family protease